MKLASATQAPTPYCLYRNYPNPFNPSTTIRFSLAEAQPVVLAVYALDGRHVTTLLNETCPAGLHEVGWNGRDEQGRSLASGTYFYRLVAEGFQQTRRMLLLK
jgi:hypothetical protein